MITNFFGLLLFIPQLCGY